MAFAWLCFPMKPLGMGTQQQLGRGGGGGGLWLGGQWKPPARQHDGLLGQEDGFRDRAPMGPLPHMVHPPLFQVPHHKVASGDVCLLGPFRGG